MYKNDLISKLLANQTLKMVGHAISHYWQYFEGENWKNFESDASTSIEMLYQNYVINNESPEMERHIFVDGKGYSVNYLYMNIKPETGSVYPIRRMDDIKTQVYETEHSESFTFGRGVLLQMAEWIKNNQGK